MVHDPIGDLLIQIKNASLARKSVMEVPYSRMKLGVAKVLMQEGYIENVEKVGTEPKLVIRIHIKYQKSMPVINGVKRISRPGLRWYVNTKKIPTVVGGMGASILSTPQGIMSGRDAKKKGIGGELLCTIW